MKVVIADGFHEADYIVGLYNNKRNDLVVINEIEDVCRYLSLNNEIPVMRARSTREDELKEAGAENCDLFISLSEDDYKNYVACRTAKDLLGAKRCIATVINPKNVDIFKSLGIDSVISSTYLLGERVNNITSVENLINSFISSVMHDNSPIIPNGQTILQENDKVIVVTTKDNTDKIINIFQRKK